MGVLGVGFVVHGLIRLMEWPLYGRHRPVSPLVTQAVCRSVLWIIGLRLITSGQPMRGRGAVVANHISWLDIFALYAASPAYFVAKSEVAGWAFVGWLARAVGTLFIARKGTQAKVQQAEFEARLDAGHRLLFFPEGTSSDGRRVLPFKSTLFAAFFHPDHVNDQKIQPVTVFYNAPGDRDARFYGWWGDMDFVPSVLEVLAQAPQGSVEVRFHTGLRVADFPDRKALAAACEAAVRSGHPFGAVGDAG
jgi:1-acyl-sn-glycerol-3-phosphate acyltransferase